ncbi:hypothetical conserved membrane protein [Rhizobium etli CFN 42]|uniref:Hypothetical conserved membrane protein n=1 Tax=Rhizobium etli (strain ATCC 51251 / DSM 11541 / JCM 21823 / NBRC 15573 / CFN 42) TaxID=347834 RepID=Q2K4X8_RHIEC|nr:hypothetical conserved membrane protein [Rhizobium etli CFN 42]
MPLPSSPHCEPTTTTFVIQLFLLPAENRTPAQTRASIKLCFWESDPVVTADWAFYVTNQQPAVYFPWEKADYRSQKTRKNALASHSLYLPRHRDPLLGRQLRRRQTCSRPYQPDDADLSALVPRRRAHRLDIRAATEEGLARGEEKPAAAPLLRRHRLYTLQRHALLGGAIYDGDQRRHRASRHSDADLPVEFLLFPHRHLAGAMSRLRHDATGRGADGRPWPPRHAAAVAAQPRRRADADRHCRLCALHHLPALETDGRLAHADGLPRPRRHAHFASAASLGDRPRRCAVAGPSRLEHHLLYGDLPLIAGADPLYQRRRGYRRQPRRSLHQSRAGVRNTPLCRTDRRKASVLSYGSPDADARRHRNRRKGPAESVRPHRACLTSGLELNQAPASSRRRRVSAGSPGPVRDTSALSRTPAEGACFRQARSPRDFRREYR